MPKHLPDEEPAKGPKPACEGLKIDLKDCLLQSDCVRVHGYTPKECLQLKSGPVPTECSLLRTSFFECKRSILDMRTRFRGRKGY